MFPPNNKPPKPHIEQVQIWQKSDPTFPHDRFVPVALFDGYGNVIGGPTNNPLPVSIAGGSINIGSVTISDFDLNDGYGNPIGSTAGALNTHISSGNLSVNDGGSSLTVDGTVNVGNFPTSFLSDTRDGYGTPIGSVGGGLNINIKNAFLPVTKGEGDYYSDQAITALSVGPSYTSFTFGFTSQGIIVANDDSGGGTRDIEFSFDNFATVHGTVKKGEQIAMDHRRRPSIQIRGVGAARPYRLTTWG